MSNIIPTGKDISNSAIANTIQIKTIDDLQKLGEILSKSGFFDDCRQAAQAVVKILAGSELGFPAFSSMVGIHIIKGKPALGANLIAAAVKRSSRYNYRVLELNEQVCKIAFLEVGTEIGISEFTAADAARERNSKHEQIPPKYALRQGNFQRGEVLLSRYLLRCYSLHPRRVGRDS